MKHVVSIADLSKKQILSILKRAKELIPVAKGKKKSKSLDGKILATCFFEPSTRTRLSFETAMQRLGGTCIGFADPSATSHLKGETYIGLKYLIILILMRMSLRYYMMQYIMQENLCPFIN